MPSGACPGAHCAVTLPCDVSLVLSRPAPPGREMRHRCVGFRPSHPGRKPPLSYLEKLVLSPCTFAGEWGRKRAVCAGSWERWKRQGAAASQVGRGCWCSAPASAIPSGRGAAGTQIVLVVPSPLPSEVTPSLSQSPPSLRGEPLLGGQSTYGSPTQGPPALLLKLLGGGAHQNHSTQTSGPPVLSQACRGRRSLSHWGCSVPGAPRVPQASAPDWAWV